MEIQKLKKKLLQEELRRRRKNSKGYRFLIGSGLVLLIAAVGGFIYYVTNLEKILTERYSRAENLVERGEYQRAADLFGDLARRHPTFHLAPQAQFQSGEILNIYLGRYHEAILAYLLVEKNHPHADFSWRAQLQVAEIYKNRLRDYTRAIVTYQKLLDSGTIDGDRVQYEIADTYFRINNFEQARIEFEGLIQKYPQSAFLPEVTYRIAVASSLEGQLKEAEANYRGVIRDWPDSPFAIEAKFGLATVLEEREELMAALQILEELQGQYPNGEALARKMSQIQERIAKKKRAI
jgi:TolA-binding protein